MPLKASKRPAVFLDRDGVITRLLLEYGPRESARQVADVELLPGAKTGLALLQQAGFVLAVVTNQPNVAKGKSTWDDAAAITDRINQLLAPEVVLDGSFACYHHPDADQVVVPELLQTCACRKPGPGLLQQAQSQLPTAIEQSWLIGDADTDILAGVAAGVSAQHCILVNAVEPPEVGIAQPDLLSAAHYIINSINQF